MDRGGPVRRNKNGNLCAPGLTELLGGLSSDDDQIAASLFRRVANFRRFVEFGFEKPRTAAQAGQMLNGDIRLRRGFPVAARTMYLMSFY